MSSKNTPLIVVPDTHGHLGHVETLINRLRKDGYLEDHCLAFLGDYLDRGPEIRGLVDLCVALQAEGHVFLAGNHEYVLEMVLNHDPRRAVWIARWWADYEVGTLASYGVEKSSSMLTRTLVQTANELGDAMPAKHRKFLTSLPFVYETDELILVHAGLLPHKPWPVQREQLLARQADNERGPSQLFSHTLGGIIRHQAPKTVVSAHTVQPNPRRFRQRLLLHCGVEEGGPLVAWISSTGQYLYIE